MGEGGMGEGGREGGREGRSRKKESTVYVH